MSTLNTSSLGVAAQVLHHCARIGERNGAYSLACSLRCAALEATPPPAPKGDVASPRSTAEAMPTFDSWSAAVWACTRAQRWLRHQPGAEHC